MTGGKPRVFLSSTIRDLADLRSAIKFWLEDYGFEVLASEWPDFPHALDREAIEAALKPIGGCDYYILLVGTKVGTVIPDLGISVTRAEFRRAREVRRGTGKPEMLHLVRAEVSAARRMGSAPRATSEEEWLAIQSFLEEIDKPEKPGDPNWISEFASFRDVVDVLRATLRLTGPLLRRALEANLFWELVENARELLFQTDSGLRPKAYWLPSIPAPLTKVAETLRIDERQAARMLLFRMALPRTATQSRSALEEAINTGQFLDYDPAKSAFVVGPLQEALLELRRQALGLESLAETFSSDATLREDINNLAAAGRAKTAEIHYYTLMFMHAAQSAMLNILGLSRAIHRHLTGVDKQIKLPDLRPAALTAEEDAKIKSEQISAGQAEEWLRS